MCEILFRGKRVDNGEWVEGFPYITHGGEHQIRYYDSESNIENCSHTVIPDTLGRFTGLTDCNGTKIFEGDVVKFKYFDDWIGKIEYDSDSALFTVIFADGDDDYFGRVSCGDCEVIGNIYDNPELMEVSGNE